MKVIEKTNCQSAMGLCRGWLKGLSELGCRFLELLPNEKRPRCGWTAYEHETGSRGLKSAEKWLARGSGLGILPGTRLWVLDADSEAQVERIVSISLGARIIPPMVETPGGGAHFYFLLPEDFPLTNLKNHLCHPEDADGVRMEVDFKFGPRTLITAPGTIRGDRGYLPNREWVRPPVMDPKIFLPDGEFWKAHRPFLVDDRPLKDRLARARVYLRTKARVSISGNRGHLTLASVCSHLVSFLNLDPSTAIHLLTFGEQSWNNRCTDLDGKAAPWSKAELWAACTAAVDSIPASGVKAWGREQAAMEASRLLNGMVECLMRSLTVPASTRVPVARVRDLFRCIGLPGLTYKRLGDCLSEKGIERILFTGRRLHCIPRLNYQALVGRVMAANWAEQKLQRGDGGFALIQRESALEWILSSGQGDGTQFMSWGA